MEKDDENIKIGSKTLPRGKRKRNGLIAFFVIIFLLIFILLDYIFVIKKSKVLAPATEDQTSSQQVTASATSNDNNSIDKYKSPDEIAAEQKNPTDTATNYYNLGLTNFDAKKYQAAVDNFAQAIKINPKNDAYYNKKAQSEMNLGNKQTAIDTVTEGISNNPNSELLKAQLDALQKDDQFGNQDGVK